MRRDTSCFFLALLLYVDWLLITLEPAPGGERCADSAPVRPFAYVNA